jgi:selenocysteine-specific elongation factor
MPYIIGTAGHIDHGKTSLIKALTGQDTDRLKEEKERGISIDLGFAHFDLPDGSSAGVVDVPGHERFIKNMLAGAHGIDVVLFTVAADDGVMPQTEEHLDIIHLLGIRLGVFVITKIDLVSPARIAEVEEEIRILTLGTALENAPIIPVSSVTGEGLAEVKNEIVRVLQSNDKRAPAGYFRLPVDRAFILQGHGVVVTGTSLSGELNTGDRVHCLPGPHSFRVRSIQVHGKSLERARWGQRVALNLTGAERANVERGQVICDEKLTLTTDRFDTFVEVRPAAKKGLRNHQRVRLHVGTAERLGKVVLLGGRDHAEPKSSTYAQITLTEPVMTLRGDHFILRDETGQRTLAGGIVIHPWARPHQRKESGLLQRLEMLHTGDIESSSRVFIEEDAAFAVPLERIYQFLNLHEKETRDRINAIKTIRSISAEGEDAYTTTAKWQQLKDAIVTILKEFHRTHPLVPGMEMEELRAKMVYDLSPKLFRGLIETFSAEKIIAKEENLVRLAEHRVQVGGQERGLMDKIKAALGQQPLAPPELKEIEKQLGVSRAKLQEIVRLLERERAVVRVATDLYYLSTAIDDLRATLKRFLLDRGEMTAASFRDLIGSSRKYTIPLLEYFDREGLTIRIGDVRRLKAAAAEKQAAPR